MAFVTRSHRNTQEEPSSGGANPIVGPGSYLGPQRYNIEHAYAPFTSTFERNTFETNHVPGPGAYTKIGYTTRKEASSQAFTSKVPRLPKESGSFANNPGPGNYLEEDSWIKNTHRKQMELPARRVTFQRMPSAPSVPQKHQSYGYEEGDAGELIMQKAQEQNGCKGVGFDTVGPAKYTPNFDSVKPKRQADFSKSRSTRELYKTSGDTPGPCHYEKPNAMGEATNPEVVDPYNPPAASASFASRVPLAHQVMQEEEQLLPGPGAYAAKPGIRAKRIPEAHQFFGTTSMRAYQVDQPRLRMAPTSATTPGPGAYDLKKTEMHDKVAEKLVAGEKVDAPPFASTQLRFEMSKQALANPGPGTYDEHNELNFVGDLTKKVVSRSGVFGTTSARFVPAKTTPSYMGGVGEEDASPGPGHYEDMSMDASPAAAMRNNKQSANFASSSNRFSKTAPADPQKPKLLSQQQVPPPGAYEVASQWEAKRRQWSHRNESFISQAPRFNPSAVNGINMGTVPGPGTYDSKKAQKPVQNRSYFNSNTARFNPASTLAPGPGSYSSSDPGKGMVKRSFNVTIDGIEF